VQNFVNLIVDVVIIIMVKLVGIKLIVFVDIMHWELKKKKHFRVLYIRCPIKKKSSTLC